jgi:rod shape-determining protein MreD
MSAGAVLRATLVVFLAAMLQTVIISSLVIGGGAPDVLLVVVVALGLLRGPVPGAVFGFTGGLIVDLVTLDTMGITSLVLTLAGFWAGRYGETTGRDRRFAPVIAVGTITLVVGLFGYVLHYMLGEEVVARHALVTALMPAFFLNLVLALPLYALVRRVVGVGERDDASLEVEVVVG